MNRRAEFTEGQQKILATDSQIAYNIKEFNRDKAIITNASPLVRLFVAILCLANTIITTLPKQSVNLWQLICSSAIIFTYPMPLILKLTPLPDTVVSVWKITESEDYFTSRLQLNEVEKQFLQSIRHVSKRLQWLSSRLMIRQHLETNEFIELKYSNEGQPSLVNFGHHVSISHTADVSAIIMSKQKKVGVDIEQLFRSVEMVAYKFISNEEKAQLNRPFIAEEMLFVWSAKEALYKFYAKGQVDFKKDLWVKIPRSIMSGSTTGSIHKHDLAADIIIHYQKIGDEHLLCWIAE